MVKGIKNDSILEGMHQVFTWLSSVEDFYEDYINHDLSLNIEKLRKDFFKQYKEYVIIRRGLSYIIQNNTTTKQILRFPFTLDTKDKVYQEVVMACDMLNNGNLIYMLENLNDNIVNHIPDDVTNPDDCTDDIEVGNVVFIVTDTQTTKLNDVTIIMDGKVEKTTIDGVCIFNDVSYGVHQFAISHDDYYPLIVYVTVDSSQIDKIATLSKFVTAGDDDEL